MEAKESECEHCYFGNPGELGLPVDCPQGPKCSWDYCQKQGIKSVQDEPVYDKAHKRWRPRKGGDLWIRELKQWVPVEEWPLEEVAKK